jgi:hypothetical protein
LKVQQAALSMICFQIQQGTLHGFTSSAGKHYHLPRKRGQKLSKFDLCHSQGFCKFYWEHCSNVWQRRHAESTVKSFDKFSGEYCQGTTIDNDAMNFIPAIPIAFSIANQNKEAL